MVSINTALQVDLADQAGASHIGGRLYSGFGGQPDFVVGALHSPGGQAVIALRSWHDRSDSSTIVPRFTDPVTSFQHSTVVIEQGRAHIFGHSQRAQAQLIIEHAAHPDARDQLREHSAPLSGATQSAAARSWGRSRTRERIALAPGTLSIPIRRNNEHRAPSGAHDRIGGAAHDEPAEQAAPM
jgi:acyl-CoA hydrolase